MKLHLWGTDFRRGSAALRRQLYCAPENRVELLKKLLKLGFNDLVPLYTCNRIEFYTTADDYFCDTRKHWMRLFEAHGLKEEHYYEGYQLEGKAALRHLIRVASSLESMVLGEPQILGQLKESVQWVRANGFPLDASLAKAFSVAFETAKRVRTQTALAEKSVSVTSLGLRWMERSLGTLPLTQFVVVGRGEISQLAIQWAKKTHPKCPILWVNRTPEKARGMAEAEGVQIVSLDGFLSSPPTFSHLLTATSSVDPIFPTTFLRKIPSRAMILDLAEPPDVDRGAIPEDIKLVQLVDLKEEAEKNATDRAQAVHEAEWIIDAAIRDYCLEQKEAPLLREFSSVEPSCLAELDQALQRLQGELPGEAFSQVEKWAAKLVKRQLHRSREHLRELLRRVTGPQNEEGFF